MAKIGSKVLEMRVQIPHLPLSLRSSSAVEPAAVNRLVIGSIPIFGAIQESTVKALISFFKAISFLAKFEIDYGQNTWSIHLPYLACKESRAHNVVWSPTGYGGSLELAAENFIEKISGCWLIWNHPNSQPRWEGPAPIIIIRKEK